MINILIYVTFKDKKFKGYRRHTIVWCVRYKCKLMHINRYYYEF